MTWTLAWSVWFALFTSPTSPAARLVLWRIRSGQEQAFETGYRRHLEWHRAHSDRWAWHDWMLVSGERVGAFLDGTFFHPWTDFDHPVDPAGDAADNERNVEPHADVGALASYEIVP